MSRAPDRSAPAWRVSARRAPAAVLGLAALVTAATASATSPFTPQGVEGNAVPSSLATSTPDLVDLDGDGDLDLVAGGGYGFVDYFENVGSPTESDFVATFATNPFSVVDPFPDESNASVDLGDVDGDGDLDLVLGRCPLADLLFYENVGSATSPAFALRTGAASPFDGVSASAACPRPALGDLDGDGDLDLVVGSDGQVAVDFFENTGSTTAPAYVQRTGALDPFDGLGVGASPGGARPLLSDVDGDGDLDLIAGRFTTLGWFENVGNATSPGFVEIVAHPLAGQPPLDYSPSPGAGDLDGDGDLDFIVGRQEGTFYRFDQVGTPASPAYVARNTTPFDGIDVGQGSAPALADLVGAAGRPDLVVGERFGTFHFFENTGSPGSPDFVHQTGVASPLDGFDVGNDAAPALADLDGDGDVDLASGNRDGDFAYLENVGTPTAGAFVERTGGPGDPFSASGPPVAGAGFTCPSFGDLDGDGDLDAVSGQRSGAASLPFMYIENVGTPLVPVFVERTGASSPLDGFTSVSGRCPFLLDLDGDGDLDLIHHGGDAFALGYLENTGTPGQPVFTLRTGSANPVGGYAFVSHPFAMDLDGDGSLDLVVGRDDGWVYHYAPEPGTTAGLLAGIGLLGVLARLRRRSPR